MKIATRLGLILILSFLSDGITQGQNPFAFESPVQTDLRAQVFRYMFAHYYYGPEVKFFCIQSERPLPESFIQRFAGTKPRVIWATDCDSTGPTNSIKNKKTGEYGMRMGLQEIKWIGRYRAEVKVEAFSDGLASNSDTLRVIYKDDHWVVTSDRITGVS
jgi:hypothetical protein